MDTTKKSSFFDPKEFAQSSDGASFVATAMAAAYNATLGIGDSGQVLDFKYVAMGGSGAGSDGILMGAGKFSSNGTRKFDATVTRTDSSAINGHGGWALSVTHKQDKLVGGENALALQYGIGPVQSESWV